MTQIIACAGTDRHGFRIQESGMYCLPDSFGSTDNAAVPICDDLVIDLTEIFTLCKI